MLLNKISFILLSIFITISTAVASQSLIIEPDDGNKPMLDLINGAKTSIKVSMYELVTEIYNPQSDSSFNETENNLEESSKYKVSRFMDAMVAAKKRGVSVKLIINDFGNTDWPTSGKDALQFEEQWAKENSMDYTLSSKAFTYTHNKYMIIDDSKVCIMTGNLSQESFPPEGNERNFFVTEDDKTIVNYMIKLFDQDLQNAKAGTGLTPPGKPDNILVTSNTLGDKVTQYIQDFLSNAGESLDIYMMYFDEKCPSEITDTICEIANNGISVRLILSCTQDPTVIEALVNRAPGVKYTIVPEGETYIHTKTFIVDSKSILLGSINMSYGSIYDNREVNRTTDDSTVVNKIQHTFNSDWEKYYKSKQ